MSEGPILPTPQQRKRRWPYLFGLSVGAIITLFTGLLVLTMIIAITSPTPELTGPARNAAIESSQFTTTAATPPTTITSVAIAPTTATIAPPPVATTTAAPQPLAVATTTQPAPTTETRPTIAAPPHTQPAPTPAASCGADDYTNVDGNCVHRPTHAPGAPPGATAQCVDGTYSFSQHRQGTCSHHGGVSTWL